MKKRIAALCLASVMVLSLTACGNTSATGDSAGGTSVKLNITTTFAGEDGNAQNFKNAVAAWEAETGNTVADASATSDETFKTRVITDFETGSEPDVLFFFNGADANSFIEAGKVVSIDEIRKEYPDYASNMNDDLIADSLVDGKKYAVPVNGFWEPMFVNTEVLDAAGVSMPGADYTWDMFKEDCQKIKDAGYAPIACALGNIPHYWWEFAIFNHTSPDTHLQVPVSVDTEGGQAWIAGMEDIKELYELGYFPDNTLSATDDETFAMFMDGKAAFLIGGLSMGYYISTKAWEDPDTRAAAVSFVEYMTSDELVPAFAQHTASALKNAPEVDEAEFNPLQIKAMKMMAGTSSLTGAVQDIFNGECRVSTFDGMPQIVTGKVTAEDAVSEGLEAYQDAQ